MEKQIRAWQFDETRAVVKVTFIEDDGKKSKSFTAGTVERHKNGYRNVNDHKETFTDLFEAEQVMGDRFEKPEPKFTEDEPTDEQLQQIASEA